MVGDVGPDFGEFSINVFQQFDPDANCRFTNINSGVTVRLWPGVAFPGNVLQVSWIGVFSALMLLSINSPMTAMNQGTTKVSIYVVLAFCIISPLDAQLIRFRLNRFGGLCLRTSKGKEHVEVYQGNKQGEKVLFDSPLEVCFGGIYTTPDGINFMLKHLANAIVNDGNRHLNSGDWQLTISGTGDNFKRLKEQMPFVAFGKLPPLTYLGEMNKG